MMVALAHYPMFCRTFGADFEHPTQQLGEDKTKHEKGSLVDAHNQTFLETGTDICLSDPHLDPHLLAKKVRICFMNLTFWGRTSPYFLTFFE